MKYLISGITGFVGPHLANLLIKEGYKVYGLMRASNGREEEIRDTISDKDFKKIEFFYGDVRDYDTIKKIFEKQEFNGVFHLAAQSHPPTSFLDPMGTFKTNTMGTINITEAIIKYQPKCKLMYCSTSEVYGRVPESKGTITEEFPINPINPYGVSKASADIYVRERAKSLNLPFFTTRAFSHCGPRRGKNFSISSDAYQIIRIKKGFQEPIIDVGTLSSRRVVMDVRDCVNAYYLLMQKAEGGESYNIGGDKLFSIGELLDKMLEISDVKAEKRINPKFVRPIDIPIQIPNSNKCRKLTGWKPKIPIEKTLEDLLDYWDSKIK